MQHFHWLSIKGTKAGVPSQTKQASNRPQTRKGAPYLENKNCSFLLHNSFFAAFQVFSLFPMISFFFSAAKGVTAQLQKLEEGRCPDLVQVQGHDRLKVSGGEEAAC